jgi:sn-glycerol 3-phosphate transport system ATP-binding protein
VLNGGQIEQVGSPLDVYHTPASTFVASFIGSPAMNLVKGELQGDKLVIGPAIIALGAYAPTPGAVTVGMRAEDLRVVSGDEGMPFTVEYVEELGSQRLVHGLVGDQLLTIALSGEAEIAGTMRIAVDPARLHFFSADNGKRIVGTSEAAMAVATPSPAPVG